MALRYVRVWLEYDEAQEGQVAASTEKALLSWLGNSEAARMSITVTAALPPLTLCGGMLAGLAAEYVEFQEGQGMVTKEKARHNLLRPEAMEAMFVLWRTTKNPVYKDWAWQMFQAFQEHCRVSVLHTHAAITIKMYACCAVCRY